MGRKSVYLRLLSGAAILAVAAAIGVVQSWQTLWTVPVIFLTGLCFAGPAMMMSAVSSGYDFFNYYFVLIITPMFIVSGVFYPIDTLPAIMQNVVQVLPLTHAVELTRPLMVGTGMHSAFAHIAVLIFYALLGYYIAVVLVRKRLG